MNVWLAWAHRPRRVWLALAVLSFSLFLFGLYLQHAVGLNPCPMCIVQRYALIGVGLLALLLSAFDARRLHLWGGALVIAVAGFGAFTAARQSWLQWFPPEILSCGRDLYGMIESFPLRRVVPMIFRGTGDCSEIDWTFLGMSIANWSFLNFGFMLLVAAVTVWAAWGQRQR
jgi:protein dithiol:quinone oxidoreductase